MWRPTFLFLLAVIPSYKRTEGSSRLTDTLDNSIVGSFCRPAVRRPSQGVVGRQAISVGPTRARRDTAITLFFLAREVLAAPRRCALSRHVRQNSHVEFESRSVVTSKVIWHRFNKETCQEIWLRFVITQPLQLHYLINEGLHCIRPCRIVSLVTMKTHGQKNENFFYNYFRQKGSVLSGVCNNTICLFVCLLATSL